MGLILPQVLPPEPIGEQDRTQLNRLCPCYARNLREGEHSRIDTLADSSYNYASWPQGGVTSRLMQRSLDGVEG